MTKKEMSGEQIAARVDKLLSVEDILAAQDIKTEEVYVPEWGGKVVVRGLTKREQDQMNKDSSTTDEEGKVKIDTTLLQKYLLHKSLKEPQFTMEQIDALWDHSGVAVDTVIKVLMNLNGMTPEAKKKTEESFRK